MLVPPNLGNIVLSCGRGSCSWTRLAKVGCLPVEGCGELEQSPARPGAKTRESSSDALLNLTTLRRRWPGLYDSKGTERASPAGQLVFRKVCGLLRRGLAFGQAGDQGPPAPRRGQELVLIV